MSASWNWNDEAAMPAAATGDDDYNLQNVIINNRGGANLDSPILHDHAANAAASILDSTSEQNQILGQLETSAEDLFGAPPSPTTSVAPTAVASTTSSPPIITTNYTLSAGSTLKTVTCSPPSNVTTTNLKPLAVASAVGSGVTTATANLQNSFILSPQPVMTMTAAGNILTSSTQTVIQQGGIQYTLQPATQAQPASTSVVGTSKPIQLAQKSKAQPQLLPKPQSNAITSVASAPVMVTCSPISTLVSAIAQQRPPVFTMAASTTVQPAAAASANQQASQQFVLNTGAITAPLLLSGQATQPILIQQPGGNPILVMRPTAPAAPTILPIVSSAQGTILLQPQAGAAPTAAAAGMITAQPQIKIITPQGRMQMQQIQTPSGPKLITVPVNAAAAAAAAAANSNSMASPNDIKDKKKKKKSNNDAENKSGLDLGELMKNVGLDELDGYNAENETTASNQQANAIISTQGGQQIMTTPLTLATSGGNQIVAQLQPQQIQVQPAASNQYQLVQGPDGQFILQSIATPTILTQATISGDGGLTLPATTPLLTASGNLIGAASVGNLTSGVTTVIASTVGAAQTSNAAAVVTTSAVTNQQVSPKKTRNPPDPNRTPLYHDERLPTGWHRKVSQRKSGASAGRFEVFIIGPTGKRFRSRNELKAFFEKTGETTLQPEHFDFSTFGTNAVNLPKEYAAKKTTVATPSVVTSSAAQASTSTAQPPPPVFKSQLSRETAEADAQISQLLESLQNNSESAKKLELPPVDSEKMSELFNSLTGGDDNSCSSPPPSAAVSSSSVVKPSKTSSSAMPPLTSGTSGFQASFLNSIASPEKAKISSTEAAALPTIPVPAASVVNSMGSMTPTPMTGGASTQRRALQNLPQNTKLVRGPNGQYSLQKVQTIELTIDQQNSLRTVQNRIQEIERLPTKSAKDENELAQLQIKQQQILAAGRPVHTQNVQEQVSLTTATSVVSSLSTSSSISIVPPASKSIPVPNVTVTKSTPIRYTHTVGNQVISLPPASGATTTTTSSASSITPSTSSSVNAAPQPPTAAITQLTDEQKRIVFEFKQKMALLPPEQQPAFIAQHKGALLKQLNFQPNQLQLLRNNHIQLQLSKPGAVRTLPPSSNAQPNMAKRPLPIGAGTIRQADSAATVAAPSGDASPAPAATSTGNSSKLKNIAWIENQIRKDQHEAVNPKYKLPFKSKDDAIKRLLRYHVFYDLDSSPEDMIKGEVDFEEKSSGMLDKYHSMLDRYHYLLTQESKRLASSSEQVMLARLWDSEERQMIAREKEQVEAGNLIQVSLLNDEQRLEYTQHLHVINDKKRKLELDENEQMEIQQPKIKYPKHEDLYENLIKDENSGMAGFENAATEDDSDEEFTLKSVDTQRAVGTILDAATSTDDDDDVLQQMSQNDDDDDDDVVAAAFGTDSVQNAINSILDTLPQGHRIETPDINNITGLFDSIEDETTGSASTPTTERDPMTEAAVNSIPQF